MLIVTLSTIPSRFGMIRPTLDCLLNQSLRPDRVIIYVPESYARFPDYDGGLPEVPEGVEVQRTPQDLGPATKILPAIQQFRGSDCTLVFCDDDQIFPRNWLEQLVTRARKRPDDCIVSVGANLKDQDVTPPTGPQRQPRALRFWRILDPFIRLRMARKWMVEKLTGRAQPPATRRPILRSGYMDIVIGAGGVLVRPEFLDHPDAFDIPENLRLTDDIWLSGILEANGVGIWVDARHGLRRSTFTGQVDALQHITEAGNDRRTANARCITYMRENFGIWL